MSINTIEQVDRWIARGLGQTETQEGADESMGEDRIQDRIRLDEALREQYGLTQEALREQLGLTQEDSVRAEQIKSNTIEAYQKLRDTLDYRYKSISN